MPDAPFLAGPRLLFFSGGSALKGLCQALRHSNHNSIHLITPFDSGGSSAKLRQAFSMPAVGDLRCRILDLANPRLANQERLHTLLSHRLPSQSSPPQLNTELVALARAEHLLMEGLEPESLGIMRQQLETFLKAMPADFDLRGASLGNLVLTGCYLGQGRQLAPCVQLLSSLVDTRGQVKSLVEASLHLGAELVNGRIILGQHLLTGKEAPAIESPIQRLWLNDSLDTLNPIDWHIDAEIQAMIASADVICYPPGSFHTSLLANLLPRGVGQAIARNPCPKVYIPNLGPDPEQLGLNLRSQVARLLEYLQKDAPDAAASELLNWILLDSQRGHYTGAFAQRDFKGIGPRVMDLQLVSDRGQFQYDGKALTEALHTIAAQG